MDMKLSSLHCPNYDFLLNEFRKWEFDCELNDHDHHIPRSSSSSETTNFLKRRNYDEVTSYSIKRKDADEKKRKR